MKVREIVNNLILSLGTIFICILVFEVVLRVTGQMPSYYYPRGFFAADKDLGYSLKPGFKAVQSLGEYTYAININSIGLRDGKKERLLGSRNPRS